MHAPGVGVAMVRCRQQIAVGRRGIDAGQHRHRSLEEIIMKAHTNGGQVLLVVDDVRFPRGGLKHLVDGAHTHRDAQQVTDEFYDAATRAAADQRQRDNHLAQPALGDHQLEQHLVFRCRRPESAIQCDAGLVRLCGSPRGE
jgi:hypothetical protein